MSIIHFLNVKNGDCSIIQHPSGRNTVIDVCNAQTTTIPAFIEEAMRSSEAAWEKGLNGNFNQKSYPVNPISYMQNRQITSVWRFILTHPDMDHMDGLKAFFSAFPPEVFWDTNNTKEMTFSNGNNGGFREEDWTFYKKLRDTNPQQHPKRMTLYSGNFGPYWNREEGGQPGGDGLNVLAPTAKLVAEANACGDHNDSSYVLLYLVGMNKILFAGDSHDKTWEHILSAHETDVSNIDLLIAPHHGRHSDRDWEFLDVLQPKLTLFGNAASEHLAYGAWKSRGLPYITNNQGGSIIVDAGVTPMPVYVSCNAFAKTLNSSTSLNPTLKAYYCGSVRARSKVVGR